MKNSELVDKKSMSNCSFKNLLCGLEDCFSIILDYPILLNYNQLNKFTTSEVQIPPMTKRLKFFHFLAILIVLTILSLLSYKTYMLTKEVDTLQKQNCTTTDTTPTKSYNIFGESEFNTVVSGYLTTRMMSSESGTEFEHAYLAIISFEEEGFKVSLKDGIEQMNGVNKLEDDTYLFNLGCFDEGKILSDTQEEEPYLDENTQAEILKSTKANPVSLTLYFEEEDGGGCECCNLAEKIRAVL